MFHWMWIFRLPGVPRVPVRRTACPPTTTAGVTDSVPTLGRASARGSADDVPGPRVATIASGGRGGRGPTERRTGRAEAAGVGHAAIVTRAAERR